MHMADALISPAVGTAMAAATAGLIGYSANKIKKEADDRKVPLMGVLGAFIFAAQMINFSIPGTGSSGHLGGGMILAILLGPWAGFIVMASVLTVQALFFADGGLLALGCNIFNLGFFPCFIAYPLIYRKITKDNPAQGRIMAGSIIASVAGLQLGSLGVVFETVFSGISELPFKTFILLMQPIHLAIGIVEGLITAAVVTFVRNARPEMLLPKERVVYVNNISMKKMIIALAASAIFIGGVLSWFASSDPDGLEWAMSKASGREELDNKYKVQASLAAVQKKTAILPDYGFRRIGTETEEVAVSPWPAIDAGTSVSGFVGAAITLLMAFLIGWLLKKRNVVR